MYKKENRRFPKVKPLSIVTRNRKELLCIIERDHPKGTTAVWQHENNVDVPSNLIKDSSPTTLIPVVKAIFK